MNHISADHDFQTSDIGLKNTQLVPAVEVQVFKKDGMVFSVGAHSAAGTHKQTRMIDVVCGAFDDASADPAVVPPSPGLKQSRCRTGDRFGEVAIRRSYTSPVVRYLGK